MMYSDTVLRTEINNELTRLAEASEHWRATWIAQSICGAHNGGLSDADGDADFWRHVGYTYVRSEVTSAINRRAGGTTASENADQYVLPGYKRLQTYYVVDRGEGAARAIEGIPVHELTDEELEQKAAMYRTQGKALFDHADEIDRFRKSRHMQAAIGS